VWIPYYGGGPALKWVHCGQCLSTNERIIVKEFINSIPENYKRETCFERETAERKVGFKSHNAS